MNLATAVFTLTGVQHGGRRVRAYAIRCGHCPTERTVPVNTFASSHGDDRGREDRHVREKFAKLGWKVGTRAKDHRCPSCFAKIRNAAKAQRPEKIGDTNVVNLHPPVEQPKVMGRDDRRIIFEKLHEVYVDEKVGYSDGWTDHRVATALGCPQAWVQGLRDEMFGPEGSNEQIRATIADAKSVLADIKTALQPADAITEAIKALTVKADRIEKAVLQIEKELR